MQNYVAALLSNITYLKTDDYALTTDGKLNIFNIEESGISPSDLSFFNENFTIEFQKNGTEGFSVMKIIAVKSSEFSGINSGDVTLAFRGTEMVLDDWITDVGMAIKAVSDMVPKIINEGSQYIPGLIGMLRKLGNLSIWNDYFKSQSQQALDYFNIEKELNNNITIVGHSLGGYLANYVTTTGDNYNYIKETRTFNAPGFNTSTMVMIELRKRLDEIINSNTSNLTGDDIIVIKNEIDDLSIKILNNPFNPNSFQKLNPFYAENGPELTSNDIVMFMPDSVNKIPMFITPQLIPTSTHGIGLLVKSSALYDTLSIFMTGSLIDNYKKITKLLETFESHPLKNNTIETVTRYISNFLGFSTNISSVVFDYISNLTSDNLNKHIYNEITTSNYKNSSAHLYALFNFIPFSISTNEEDSVFKNTNFDISLYTEQNINERFNLFEKYQNLMTPTISTATLKNLNIYENYKIIYEEDNSNPYIIFDEYNKTVLTNDSRSFSSSMGIGDFTFYGDSFSNIETIYLKNNQSTLFVNTLNNKVYDTYLDDYIILNTGETILDLSYGNDTINIDVSSGATLKDINIKDNGMGDLFIFNGSNNSDIVQGTQYNDKIIGAAGEDHLFGGDGDDVINGGIDNDMIFGGNGNDTLIGDDGNDYLMGGAGSNSLDGGAGDDTLNIYNTLTEYHDIRGDSLNGGTGFNKLFGTGYGDTYTYGGGVDTIYENDKHFGINYVDKLIFKSTTQASQVSLYNILNNLVIAINGLNKIFVIDYYNNNYSYLDEIHFTNIISGEPIIWDTQYILNHTISKKDSIITGSISDDNLQGDDTNEEIYGNDGHDNIRGGKGNDLIYGGNGNDIIYGEDGNDIIYGNSGNDKLYGDDGNDIIYGGEGNDSINGGIGDDTIYGGDGSDTIIGGLGNDIIYGDDGNDTITISGTIKTEFDKIYAGDGIDTISNSINNTYIRAGNDNDKIFTSGDNVDIDAENGNDTIYMNTGSGSLKGGSGDDTFVNNGNPSTTNYIIEGGLGNDTINMSRGNHKIIYSNGDGHDTIVVNGSNTTSQTDLIRIKGYSKNHITSDKVFLSDNGKSLNLKLSNDDSINLVNFLVSKSAIQNLKYFEFDDGTLTSEDLIEIFTHIKGTELNDNLSDTVFNDFFDMSGGGIDSVSLKSGNDTVYGGEGNTTITLYSSNNIIYSGTGNDRLSLTGNFSNVFNLKDYNNGHDSIIGNGYSKTTVNVSNNVYIADMILNGSYYFYTFAWGVNSSVNLRTDFLNNQIVFNINGNPLTDLTSLNLNGNESNNYLKVLSDRGQLVHGNGGNDTIHGNNGDDTIYGDDGEDIIFDTVGNNTIYGGMDNDVINTGSGDDKIYGGNGDDSINSGNGTDIVYGGDGNDRISGSGINSEFYGGNGNDSYNVSLGTITDYSGINSLYFGTLYTAKVTLESTLTGFNVIVNDEQKISYNGNVNRIERSVIPPDGYIYRTSLVGNEIARLFELEAALETETDTTKISLMKTEIDNLWKYDQP